MLKQIPCLTTGINERLMKMWLPVCNRHFISIKSPYKAKRRFMPAWIPATNKHLLFGDFNISFGKANDQYGVGLVGWWTARALYSWTNVLKTNTFWQAGKYTTMWMHLVFQGVVHEWGKDGVRDCQAMQHLLYNSVVVKELNWKVRLSIYRSIYVPTLKPWSWALGNDRTKEIADTSGRN